MIALANPTLGEEELDRIAAVFDRGRLARGPEVDAFESEFASVCGASHGVATANGTAALHAALEALGLGPDDRVAVPTFSFIASANAVRWCGAEPTFVDVCAGTYALDLDALDGRLRGGEPIDAVVAVHPFGLPCDVGRLLDLAEEYEFAVVEDAAQAHGAAYEGRPVGSFGDAACFSFFATKNVTTGEGGMVVTDRGDVADRARSFIEHGRTEEGYAELGHNFCMSEIAAAVGRAQLGKLPDYNDARRRNAQRLSDALRDTPVDPPSDPHDRRHVYHQYTIETDDRDALREHLDADGIQTGAYYETPLHDHPAFDDRDVGLPSADRLKRRVLSLPVHHGLSDEEIDRIGGSVARFFEGS